MNKKAFTLTEIIAVMVILGIISTIVFFSVSITIKNSKEKAYDTQINQILSSAKKMVIQNPDMILDDETFKITIDELIENGYLTATDGHIKNPKNQEENIDGCVLVSYSNEYNQYVYEYSEECIVPEPPVEYIDSSGANKPELYDKMIPVKWNGTNWTYADTYEEWYDYNKKEWANAIVLNPGKTYNVGQDIEMTDIAMMYVWIPRYKYTIFNGNNGSISPQEINVTFESGIASTGTVTCTENALGSGSISENCGTITNGTSTYTHPAFTFGDKELTGIWVGKFEASTADSTCYNTPSDTNCNKNTHTIIVKPNIDSLRYTNVSNFFTSILNIKTTYSMSNIDSHMMKNMEWGAVAYLGQSRYGRCTSGGCEEITINNVYQSSSPYRTHTGCAGDSVSASSVTTCASTNTYETTKGVKASTTGNIYGIYDMSGANWEYVMGNMVDSSGSFYSSSSGIGSAPDSKYYDKYTYDASSYTTHSRGRLGDAIKETLQTYGSVSGGWYSDNTYFVASSYSWFLRGGRAASKSGAGLFNFNSNSDAGGLSDNYSARSVVVAQ